MYQHLRRVFAPWLCHRRLPLLLALLAILLTLPALGVGWQMDDYLQRLMMLKLPQVGAGPEEIFTVLNGDPQVIHRYMDLGLLPWWTVPRYRISFLRVFSIFTLWVDYALWPDSPVLMHLQSLLWFGALIAVATLLYRRIMGPTYVAGFAALLYAVDDAHAIPAAWLANRNALLSTFFGLVCLLAYDRWRREGWRWGAILSPLSLILALLSGEAALATAGYLLAYTLFLDRLPWRRRLLASLPNAAVLLSWALVYWLFGFGTYGSGVYIDPLRNPATFLVSFFHRAPLLLLGQWSPIPAEAAGLTPEKWNEVFWGLGLGCILLLVFLFIPLLRRDRVARFWGLGMILSLFPVTAVFPSNRLLFFVGLGAMGLLAQFLEYLFLRREGLPAARIWQVPARGMAVFFLGVHLIFAPLFMPINVYAVRLFGEPITRAIASVPTDPAITRQDLIIVNPPDYLMFVSLIPTLRTLQGKPLPRRVRALVAGPVPLEMTRLDDRTLRVRLHGRFFTGILGRMFRGKDQPLKVGEEIRLSGLTVQVTALAPTGDPQEIVYRFSAPLEDPSLRWLRWEAGVYVPFTPPLPGETITLPAPLGPFEFFYR